MARGSGRTRTRAAGFIVPLTLAAALAGCGERGPDAPPARPVGGPEGSAAPADPPPAVGGPESAAAPTAPPCPAPSGLAGPAAGDPRYLDNPGLLVVTEQGNPREYVLARIREYGGQTVSEAPKIGTYLACFPMEIESVVAVRQRLRDAGLGAEPLVGGPPIGPPPAA